MNVLIAGCGYVGTALGRLLISRGASVWAVRRNPEGLPIEFTSLSQDLTSNTLVLDIPVPVSHVVFCAAADQFSEEAYRKAYVEAPRRLIETLASRGHRPERLLFTSSTSVYGDAGGAWVDEETPPTPVGFSGRILLEGEKVVLNAPFPTSVIRLGGIYGPGRTHTIDKVRSGEAVCVRGVHDYMNHIHRDDCAGAILHLLTTPRIDPVYIGVDQDPAERCEAYRWIAEMLEAPPPRTVDQSSESYARRSGSKRCRSDRLVQSGYSFLYPTYREGYGALIKS